MQFMTPYLTPVDMQRDFISVFHPTPVRRPLHHGGQTRFHYCANLSPGGHSSREFVHGWGTFEKHHLQGVGHWRLWRGCRRSGSVQGAVSSILGGFYDEALQEKLDRDSVNQTINSWVQRELVIWYNKRARKRGCVAALAVTLQKLDSNVVIIGERD